MTETIDDAGEDNESEEDKNESSNKREDKDTEIVWNNTNKL